MIKDFKNKHTRDSRYIRNLWKRVMAFVMANLIKRAHLFFLRHKEFIRKNHNKEIQQQNHNKEIKAIIGIGLGIGSAIGIDLLVYPLH